MILRRIFRAHSIDVNKIDKKSIKNCVKTFVKVPTKPTWDLLPTKELDRSCLNIDVKKLEKLSMLTIDEATKNSLYDAISVVQPMCNAVVTESTKSLIYYQHLGCVMLREDDEKFLETPKTSVILKNAANKFEDYFLSPSSGKTNSE